MQPPIRCAGHSALATTRQRTLDLVGSASDECPPNRRRWPQHTNSLRFEAKTAPVTSNRPFPESTFDVVFQLPTQSTFAGYCLMAPPPESDLCTKSRMSTRNQGMLRRHYRHGDHRVDVRNSYLLATICELTASYLWIDQRSASAALAAKAHSAGRLASPSAPFVEVLGRAGRM
jgi:hypothetical protein